MTTTETLTAEDDPHELLFNPEAEAIYGEVAPRLDEFFGTDRFAKLETFGVQRAELEFAGRLHGHPVYVVDQTDHAKNSSYKIHGAGNAIIVAVEKAEASGIELLGIDAASAGNHGEAVSVVGEALAIPVIVDAADSASDVKVGLMEDHGAKVNKGGTIVDAIARARNRGEQPGRVVIPPYNHYDVVTGQAILGVNLFEDLVKQGVEGKVMTMGAVGGGGHMSGLVMGYRYAYERALENGYQPPFDVNFMGVQMAGGDLANRAVKNYRQDLPHETIEDLCPDGKYDNSNDGTFAVPGELTLPVLADKKAVEDIMIVSKGAVGSSMHYLSGYYRKLIEPAGALSRAGAEAWSAKHPVSVDNKPVTLITFVTGSNVTQELYWDFMRAKAAEAAVVESQRAAETLAFRERQSGFINIGLGTLAARRSVKKNFSWAAAYEAGSKIGYAPTGKYRTGLVEPAVSR